MTRHLYDLAGADAGRRFSPYCWRVKLALAAKGLAFDTVSPGGLGAGGAQGEFVAARPRAEVPALEVAEQGGGSVALKYEGGRTVMRLVPLANVAGKTRHMPEDFMLPGVSQVSEAGMAYLNRLIPGKYEIGRPFV